MKATRYRAYAKAEVQNRGSDASHEVEEVAFEGALADGKAEFDAGDRKVSKVAFYGGSKAEEVSLGEMPVNKSGKISVEYVEA